MSRRPGRVPGLYLHVPFCSAVCPYCDFSVVKDDRSLRRSFVGRLVREARAAAPDGWQFDTLYFGGGTPSALEPDELSTLLEAIRGTFEVAPDARVYLEANPEDVGSDSLSAWRQLGVSTLSLGAQSFEDRELRFLGRRHTAEEARRAVRLALECGFETVSVDVIFGLPDQTPEALRRTVRELGELGAQHVSGYQLTVHEGTPFERRRATGRLVELSDVEQADLYFELHASLGEIGRTAYEVSNFASSEAHRSKHNLKYWTRVDYLGLGPSAHSFRGERRWWNLRELGAWGARVDRSEPPIAGEESLSAQERALEELMLSVRLTCGIDLPGFRDRHGVDILVDRARAVDRLAADGLIGVADGRLRPTVRGLAVADALARALSFDA